MQREKIQGNGKAQAGLVQTGDVKVLETAVQYAEKLKSIENSMGQFGDTTTSIVNFEMQVLELRKNEYTVTEISSILHVSSEKVSNAIKSLTEKGLLATKYKNLHGKSMLKRKQRALELLEDGKKVMNTMLLEVD